MVKSYLKFEQSSVFGQICSNSSNVVHLSDAQSSSGRAVCGANEDVLVWNVKRGELESRWTVAGNRAEVTVIARSQTDPDVFAVGYSDGKIRLWDSKFASVLMTFNGHKSAVLHLAFDQSGYRLASGGRDTNVIVWDIVNETGLFKLRGHKNQITSIQFLSAESQEEGDNFLISTSKDALIKIWDLTTQHCVETQVAQSNGECWALGLSPDQNGCITAGNDGEMKVWTINKQALAVRSEGVEKVLKEQGTVYRNGKDRTISIRFHPRRDIIAIHGAEKAVELWRIKTEEETRKSMQRKRRRKREKHGLDVEMDHDNEPVALSEVLVHYVTVRTGAKVRSVDWASDSHKIVSLLCATSSNLLEVFDVSIKERKKETPEYDRSLSIGLPGHRSDIRCVAFSSDDRMLASASQGSLKIWNTKTQNCLRTLDCGHALCLTFLPGDKLVVVGTREGKLELFDIASSNLLDTIDAHDRDVWALQVSPDGRSLVTGSADKTAKFWDFKVVQDEVLGTTRTSSRLTLVHKRTLKTADDILAVGFSPDGKFVAVSTLDTTVKVFYTDSLKLYLSLYGHKLPVLSLDISYDSKLIVTSSADKTVRVWGFDFGDCHRTFLAHTDSILSVKFVPTNSDGNGHHFFSASKDSVVKYYDGDKFEQIQKLDGHHGEIWAMAVSHNGQLVATASHDKSIRLWAQTDEQVFLEEEREKELEELYENTLLTSLENEENELVDETVEATGTAKQSTETLIASEKITEALTIGAEDLEIMAEHEAGLQRHQADSKAYPKPAAPSRHPIYLANNNVSAVQYLLQLFVKLPPSHLQDALLLLSFSQLPTLFTFLARIIDEQRYIPLVARILFFMLKVHHTQIVSSRLMRPELERLQVKLRSGIEQSRREVGFNLAGLRITGRRLQAVAEASVFVDDEAEVERQGKKRTFVNIA